MFFLEYIHKICPFYDMLHDIFAEKRSVNTVNVLESSSADSDFLIEALDGVFPLDNVDAEYEVFDSSLANETHYVPGTSQNDQSSYIELNNDLISTIRPTQRPSPRQRQASNDLTRMMSQDMMEFSSEAEANHLRSQRKRRCGQGGSLSTLVELQEKRIKLEETKVANDVELKKLEMEQNLKIREMELQSQERIEMARIRAEYEVTERIKRYELQLNAENSR